MNEALKGFEMKPLYIELWIMKWKIQNRILQYFSDSPVKKARGERHYLSTITLNCHLCYRNVDPPLRLQDIQISEAFTFCRDIKLLKARVYISTC